MELEFCSANESELLLFLKNIALLLNLIKPVAHLFPPCLLFINGKAEILNFIPQHKEKEQCICPSKADAGTALQSLQPSTTTHPHLTTLQKEYLYLTIA